MSVRQATHADSWYSGHASTLNAELTGWLDAVKESTEDSFHPPVKGCKAIIAPHAGYSYSGPAAAWAYSAIDTTGISRVFILGPSHHVYLSNCALSKQKTYATPIGDLPLDLETIDELRQTGMFADMSLKTDEDEHSIEMHLPYVRKVFENLDIKIVPILVGAIDHDQENEYGKLLAPYISRSDTICVISSDFCHWGSRFSYTFYYPSPPPCTPMRLTKSNSNSQELKAFPIHESISALDHEAMDLITLPLADPPSHHTAAGAAHDAFTAYLARTKNTICGRHPIGVLLGLLLAVESNASDNGPANQSTLKFVRYEQSSACINYRDSSVSYASAYVVF